MSTITFDTFKFVDRLTREQAAAIVEAQRGSLAESLDTTLATKTDIGQLNRRLDGVNAKIDKPQWTMGILIAIAVANFAKQFFYGLFSITRAR